MYRQHVLYICAGSMLKIIQVGLTPNTTHKPNIPQINFSRTLNFAFTYIFGRQKTHT